MKFNSKRWRVRERRAAKVILNKVSYRIGDEDSDKISLDLGGKLHPRAVRK